MVTTIQEGKRKFWHGTGASPLRNMHKGNIRSVIELYARWVHGFVFPRRRKLTKAMLSNAVSNWPEASIGKGLCGSPVGSGERGQWSLWRGSLCLAIGHLRRDLFDSGSRIRCFTERAKKHDSMPAGGKLNLGLEAHDRSIRASTMRNRKNRAFPQTVVFRVTLPRSVSNAKSSH